MWGALSKIVEQCWQLCTSEREQPHPALWLLPDAPVSSGQGSGPDVLIDPLAYVS